MTGKTQEEIGKRLDKIERKYKKGFKDKLKSITMDNGCEFVNQQRIESFIITKIVEQ
jgi:transposase, IS30 family